MYKTKQISLIISVVFLIFSCATGIDLNAPLKEYRMESFSVYDGSENLIQTVNIHYNEIDKPSEIIALGEAGNTLGMKVLKYTEAGKLSTLTNSTDGKSFILSDYFYSDKDFLVEVRTVNDKDELLGTSSYINDERGNPVEWISEYSGSNEKIHFIMEYDESDHLIKSSEMDKQGNVIYYSASEYDGSGNEISYSIYSPEGNLDQQLLSYYIEDQLLRTEIKDDTGNVLYYTTYELNEMNKPFKISSYNQYGDLNDHIEITYDENGNELMRESFDYEGKRTDKIVREYDADGNNTSVILFDNDDTIVSVTKNSFVKKPLNMDDEEFNTLVFKL